MDYKQILKVILDIGEQMINSLLIYGTAICYTGWQVKTRKVKRAMWQERDLCSAGGEKLCDEQGQSLRVPEQHVMESVELIYDDPVVANISLQEFFVDPAARNIDEARFCGHSEYVTRGMLEELEAQGKYKIDWDKLPTLSDDNGREGMDSFEPGDVKGLYLVHHYWEDDRHAVFVNRAQCM